MSATKFATRKLVLFATSVAVAAVAFSASEAGAAVKKPVFGAITLNNQGQVTRHFDVAIFQQRPHHKQKLVESASVWIGAGGDYKWNRAVVGKSYRVQVTSQPSGEIAYDDTREVQVDDGSGTNQLPIPIEANPGEEDPRDTQIADLQTQLVAKDAERDAALAALTADYEAQIVTINANCQQALADLTVQNNAQIATLTAQYDAQIATLNAQHQAALAALKANYDAQIAALNATISGLNTQVTDLQAQVASLVTELATFVTPLTVERDNAFSSATAKAGVKTVQLAQFSFAASDVQAVSITKLKFDKDQDKEADIENLYVEINGTKFGNTRGGVGDTQNSMEFSGLYTIGVGQTATVRVYADIKSSTTAHTALTLIDLIGWVANGYSNGATIPFPGSVNGQDVVMTK